MVVIVNNEPQVKEVLEHEVVRDTVPHTLVFKVVEVEDDGPVINIWSATETFYLDTLKDTIPKYNWFYSKNFTFGRDKTLAPILTDLGGIELKLSGMTYLPYTTWREVPPGTGNAHLRDSGEKFNIQLDGIEYTFLVEFCQRHNCTINVEFRNI